jgi:hypothetical protein
MKKLLALALLAFVACKKEDTTVRQQDYSGKWNILQTVNKQYTLEDGDTAYTRYFVTNHAAGTAYADFRISSRDVILYLNNLLDTMTYEGITPTFFRLNDTLCEITSVTDSSFQFNTLVFDGNVIPDRIQVTQDFFVLHR